MIVSAAHNAQQAARLTAQRPQGRADCDLRRSFTAGLRVGGFPTTRRLFRACSGKSISQQAIRAAIGPHPLPCYSPKSSLTARCGHWKRQVCGAIRTNLCLPSRHCPRALCFQSVESSIFLTCRLRGLNDIPDFNKRVSEVLNEVECLGVRGCIVIDPCHDECIINTATWKMCRSQA